MLGCPILAREADMPAIGRLVRSARNKVRHHGLRKTAWFSLLRLLGTRRWLSVLHAHYAEEPDPAFLAVAERYRGAFLTPRALAQFARDPQAGLSDEFVRHALARGDKCYGAVHDGALKAYGWYADKPTPVCDDLQLHFSRGYIYMYKGFTNDAHRGKRLFPSGVSRALAHYRSAGYKGMLLYVEATNLDSLKSCARMGFRIFGSVYVVRLLGRSFIYATPGCARFGFRVEASPSGAFSDPARTAGARTL